MTISIKMTALAAAMITLAIGVLSMIAPHQMAKLGNLKLQGNAGMAEFRSVYAGMMIAMAAYVLWYRTDRSFEMAGFMWAGAAIARLASMGLNKSLTAYNGIALAGEIVVAYMFIQ